MSYGSDKTVKVHTIQLFWIISSFWLVFSLVPGVSCPLASYGHIRVLSCQHTVLAPSILS